MTEFLKQELHRLVHEIPKTDPTKPEYQILLQSIECLDAMGQTIEGILDPASEEGAGDSSVIKPGMGNVIPFTAPEFPEPVPKEAFASEGQTHAPEIKSETVSSGSPELAEKPAEAAEEKTFSSSEVRRALVDARNNGVDIKAVMAKLGADNFQAVPAARYGELMKELGVVE